MGLKSDLLDKLSPYLYSIPGVEGKNPDYVDEGTDFFPYSVDPSLALHHARCFSEDLKEALTVDESDLCEVVFSYVISKIENLIAADNGNRPFCGYDFMGKNLQYLLPEAAEMAGIPIYETPLDFFDENNPSDSDASKWLGLLQGNSVGDFVYSFPDETLHNYYFCCLLNPYEGARNLLNLLGKQLEIAQDRDEISKLGQSLLPFIQGDDFQEYFASEFERGIELVDERLLNKGKSPAYYLGHHSFYLPPMIKSGLRLRYFGPAWRTSSVVGFAMQNTETSLSEQVTSLLT